MEAVLPRAGSATSCYLIDLSSWARGTYELLRKNNSVGQTSIISNVLGRLMRLIRGHRPAFLAVCADTPGPVWQHEIWPDYQAGRSTPGPEYDEQIDRIVDILFVMGIPVYRGSGWSADDYIGALVPRIRALGLGLQIVIVSKDHDLWQLIADDGSVVAWDGDRVTGPEEVRARYGVSTAQLPELMALVGDGDEAPGLPRVGVKTGAVLLAQHGGLRSVLAAHASAKGAALQASLKADHERGEDGIALLGLRLVKLRADVPAEVSLRGLALGWGEDEAEQLRRIGAELGIDTLKRMGAIQARADVMSIVEEWEAEQSWREHEAKEAKDGKEESERQHTERVSPCADAAGQRKLLCVNEGSRDLGEGRSEALRARVEDERESAEANAEISHPFLRAIAEIAAGLPPRWSDDLDYPKSDADLTLWRCPVGLWSLRVGAWVQLRAKLGKGRILARVLESTHDPNAGPDHIPFSRGMVYVAGELHGEHDFENALVERHLSEAEALATISADLQVREGDALVNAVSAMANQPIADRPGPIRASRGWHEGPRGQLRFGW